MRNYAICPISNKRINERVARLNATFTVLLLLSFVLTFNPFLIAFLAVDFLLRSTGFSKYSVLGFFSRNIVKKLSLNENLINAGPKIFAARIGFLFSVFILSFFLSGFIIPVYILAAVLGLFSFLEAAFGLCVACEIYPFVYKLFCHSSFIGAKNETKQAI